MPSTPLPLYSQTPSRTARPKSPLRRVLHGGITKVQKDHMIANLRVEIEERSRRMRSQFELQAAALRKRIEMRISRVPRKYWKEKMGDLLAGAAGKNVSLASWALGTKRLSDGPGMKALGPAPTGGVIQKKPSGGGLSRSGTDGSTSSRPTGRVREPSPQKHRPASPSKPIVRPPPPPPSPQKLRPASPVKPALHTIPSQSPLKRTNALKARPLHATLSTDALLAPERSPAKRPLGTGKPGQLTANKVRSAPNMKLPDRQGSLKENKVENLRPIEPVEKAAIKERLLESETGTPGKKGRVLRKRK